jgi:hypothetical protein
MKAVGKPCAGKPLARFDEEPLRRSLQISGLLYNTTNLTNRESLLSRLSRSLQLECPMNVYEIVIEKIVTLLEQGTVPWRRPWSSSVRRRKRKSPNFCFESQA